MTKSERIATRKWLKRYRWIQKELAAEIRNYEEFTRDIYNPLCSPNVDGIPRGSSLSDQTAATVERIQKEYGEVLHDKKRKIKELENGIKEIETVINRLDADERCVLYYRYVIGLSWNKMPEYIHYEERQCRRIENKALSKIWPTMSNLHVIECHCRK